MKKLLLTILSISQFLIANNALAQEQLQSQGSELFVSQVSADQRLLTERLGSFDSAFIRYNFHSVQLVVQATSNPCTDDRVCPMLVTTKPVVIDLQVVDVVKTKCQNIYYARTSANVKAKFIEQIRIVDPNVGRCNYIQAQQGEVLYRIQADHAEWINFKMSSVGAFPTM